MHWAAENNSKDVAELLLRTGAGVSAKNKVSTTRIKISDMSLLRLLKVPEATYLIWFSLAYDMIARRI